MLNGIDIGINLTDRRYNKDRDDVVDIAEKNGIGMIITGCSPYSNQKAIEYVKKYNNKHILCTIGLHPHNAIQYTEDFLVNYLDLLDKNKDIVVAIGEIGLDFDRMRSPKEIQIHTFYEMINIAKRYNKPLFLHERAAVDNFYSIMYDNREIAEKSVVHCFTGNKTTVKKYLDLGCMIGITGWICDNNRNQDLIDAIKYIPLDRLMIETDGPYLTPKGVSPSRNVPTNLPYVWKKISEVLGKEEEKLKIQLLNNTISFFDITEW